MCMINCSGGCKECAPEDHAEWFIERRIACPDAGYPLSEARFSSVWEYIEYLEGKE